MSHNRVRTVGCLSLLVGALGLTIFCWGLSRDIEWMAQPFYAFAWWSFILMLDGYCAMRRGHSLFTVRYRYLSPLCFWSITFWFFFELLNIRFQNWYYVGVFRFHTFGGLVLSAVFVVFCYSTVFLGIFQCYEALTAAGLFRRWQGRRGKLPHWISYVVQAIGSSMVATALLSPYYFAPLIWGSFTLVVDPYNYRRGGRSILRDIEARDWGLLARIFVAGLVCGIVWESFNFFAPQKWVYTVRGLEGFKLFEMPLVGFLGFPALAFDSFAGFALLSSFLLGNETWENPGDLRYRLRPRSKPSRHLTWFSRVAQPCCWSVIAFFMMGTSIGSVQLELGDLGLNAEEMSTLSRHGVVRPRQLLRKSRDPEWRRQLRVELHWVEVRMQDVRNQAELYCFKGIGRSFGTLLEKNGVRQVKDLIGMKPEALHQRLRKTAEVDGAWAPRVDMVRVWVLAAEDPGIVMRRE